MTDKHKQHCFFCTEHDTDIGKVYDDIFEGRMEDACKHLSHITEITSEHVYFAIISQPLLTDIEFGIREKDLPLYIEFSKKMLSYNIEPYLNWHKPVLEKLQAFLAEHST